MDGRGGGAPLRRARPLMCFGGQGRHDHWELRLTASAVPSAAPAGAALSTRGTALVPPPRGHRPSHCGPATCFGGRRRARQKILAGFGRRNRSRPRLRPARLFTRCPVASDVVDCPPSLAQLSALTVAGPAPQATAAPLPLLRCRRHSSHRPRAALPRRARTRHRHSYFDFGNFPRSRPPLTSTTPVIVGAWAGAHAPTSLSLKEQKKQNKRQEAGPERAAQRHQPLGTTAVRSVRPLRRPPHRPRSVCPSRSGLTV
jgi:hypothetical protein